MKKITAQCKKFSVRDTGTGESNDMTIAMNSGIDITISAAKTIPNKTLNNSAKTDCFFGVMYLFTE